MPIYSYKCTACQGAVDVLQKISDPPPGTCPHCGAPALVKQLTAAGFQLKGSGWYATDFKNGPARKEDPAPSSGQPEQAGAKAPKEPEVGGGQAAEAAAPAASKDAPAQPAAAKDAPAQSGTAGGG